MNLGLANTIHVLQYYIFSELVAFDSFSDKPWLRTDKFLDEHSYDKLTLDYIYMLLKFLIPASTNVSQKFERSLKNYMDH